MSIALATVRDPDFVASFSPLVFDDTGAYVTGKDAVLRRCLYSICAGRGRLVYSPGRGIDIRDLENASLTSSGIEGWRAAIAREVRQVDFVLDVRAGLLLDRRTWLVAVVPTLVDGRSYVLEVGIGEAGAAIRSLGS